MCTCISGVSAASCVVGVDVLAMWCLLLFDSLITNVGTSTLFFTFSSGDMIYILRVKRDARMLLIIHILLTGFCTMIEIFVKYWLYDTLKVEVVSIAMILLN